MYRADMAYPDPDAMAHRMSERETLAHFDPEESAPKLRCEYCGEPLSECSGSIPEWAPTEKSYIV